VVFANTGAIVSGIGGAAPNPAPTFASGVTTISYLRNADLGIGMTISGTGIQAGTTITAINTELGTVTLSNATTAVSSGSYTLSGNVNRTFSLTGSNAGANEIAGILSDATGGGTLAVTKSGAGFWKLSGTNTYSGGTSLNGGTLGLGSSGAIGSSGTISFGGGKLQYSSSNTTDYSSRFSTAAGQAYSVDTNGQSVTWASNLSSSGGTLTKSGTGTLILTGANSHTTTTISGGTLQVGNGGTTGSLGSGAVTNNGSLGFNRGNALTVANDISGTGSLTKSGSSSLNLTGTNTYTGATTISAGTLYVNGTLGNTALTIASGATLGGGGTTTGSVATVSATSVIAPGNSPGTLTIGSLDVTNGATLNFELGTSSDLLAITGALTAGGTLNFNFSDSGGLIGYTSYTLFTFDSESGLDYADLNALTLPGQALNTAFGTGGWMINGNSLQVQFVPEPSSALLGLLGAAGLLSRRRRLSIS
jgi:MYXO-CTERM domain-containing protein